MYSEKYLNIFKLHISIRQYVFEDKKKKKANGKLFYAALAPLI